MMNALVRKIRIGNRIVLGVLPVCGALLLFAGIILRGQVQDVARADVLIGLSDLAVQTNAVVHELQKERGSSALFLGSKGTQFGSELAERRKESDLRMKSLTATIQGLDSQLRQAVGADLLANVEKGISQFPALRQKVDQQDIVVKDAVGTYTANIRQLITLVVQVGTAAPDALAARQITSYVTLSEAKEAAGQERATGSAGFAAGKFDPDLYKRFIELGSAQKTALSLYERYASPEAMQALKTTVSSEVEDPVQSMRKLAVDSVYSGDTGGVKAPVWFAASTKRIDALKSVEDSVASAIKNHATVMRSNASQTLVWGSVGLACLLLVTAVILLAVIRSIVLPVRTLSSVMTRLAGGDLQITLQDDPSHDEVGDMARATMVFKTKSEEQRRLEQQQAELEHQAALDRQKMLNDLADHFERTVKAQVMEVGRSSEGIRTTAQVMANRSEHSGGHSLAVGDATQRNTERASLVSAATHEMSVSVNEIAQQVTMSSQTAQKAVTEISDTVERMSGLSDAVSSIGAVVKMISDIAKQTNLLALNATIEAARAGDAGKGFAVVANEVKTLANQTTKAADDIIRQVTTVQQSTGSMNEAIMDVMTTIQSLEQSATAIATAVQEQEAATNDIANNIAIVASDSNMVYGTVSNLAQSSVMTCAGTVRVIWSAKRLSSVVAALEQETMEFLKKVRS